MHPKSAIPVIGLFLLALVFIAFIGCSEEKVVVPDSNLAAGSPTDPEFLLLKEKVDGYFTETEGIFALGLENIFQLPTDTETIRNQYAAMGPNDTVQYVYINGWHVTYISRYNAYYNDYFRDSVQFMLDEVPVQEPDNIDHLQYIRYWGFTINPTDETRTNKYGYANVVFDNLDQEVSTINGINDIQFEWNYVCPDSTVKAVFDMQVAANNITVRKSFTYGWTSGCPCSGAMTMTIDNSYNVTRNLASDFWIRNWTATVTFEDGVGHVRLISDGEYWEFDCQICDPPVQL